MSDPSNSGTAPLLSVVVATFNRPEGLTRLLQQLADQTLRVQAFEVVVVDDGSRESVQPRLARLEVPYPLRIVRQENQGAAVARHRGALEARGRLLLFVDDDMQIGRTFLKAHARLHQVGSRRVVLGRIKPASHYGQMPLFERWHARMVDELGKELATGRTPRGTDLYTGNVSMRRSDYLAVGGFDASLGHSEDAELGLRLEASGASFVFSEDAFAVHESDRVSLEAFLRRALRYGQFAHRIARKHPHALHADPWRFVFELNPVSRPIVVLSALAPGAMGSVARAAYGASRALDAQGFEAPALAGTTLVFGIQYFRGVGLEAGRPTQALRELAGYGRTRWARALRERLAPWRRFEASVREDHQVGESYRKKYAPSRGGPSSLARSLVERAGLQITTAFRLMTLSREAGLPLAAKVISRLVRHLFAADLHWEASLEPGILVVHGMGLTISHAARVGAGCILSHNVTLGMGIDPISRAIGAPCLERNVQVGPGATLLGPITVGEGTKIAPGVVLTWSVPPHSVVEAARPLVRPKRAVAPVSDEAVVAQEESG